MDRSFTVRQQRALPACASTRYSQTHLRSSPDLVRRERSVVRAARLLIASHLNWFLPLTTSRRLLPEIAQYLSRGSRRSLPIAAPWWLVVHMTRVILFHWEK